MLETQTNIQSSKCFSAKELAEIRELLGEILIALQSLLTTEEQQDLWRFFELLLKRYVEEKRKE